ncbi:hypothetical protein CEW83_00860 [Parazoarcus communis]|uniref:DUF7931 domain-containing protein n=1 Tax=Parazoarcus communis TaxID=41977 RepID=A0A2U8GK96_9RHOO|nr:hypothetical protein [Parazoarcus communis]AWI73949.1 hypothetical protein CEW83_00860 [Parazoarcus communis]
MTEPVTYNFDTWSDFRGALLELVGRAQSTLLLSDPDLGETGFESSAGIEALTAFLQRSAQPLAIRILLKDAAYLEQRCPRLLGLLSRFSQRMMVRVASDVRAVPDAPFAIADGKHLVTRFHHERARGKHCTDDPQSTSVHIAQFETLWASGETGPNGVQLGL